MCTGNSQFSLLQVRNGSEQDSPVIRKLCGWVLPDPIFATTNTVGLSFVTDVSVTYPGYDITYTATSQGKVSQQNYDIIYKVLEIPCNEKKY
jgi:hypothetical protein